LELRRRQGPIAAGPVGLLAWTQRHRALLKPEMPLDFGRHPFLVDLYQCTARTMVVYKASQLGASEYAVSYALHAADQRGATVLYVFPTDTHVSDFSSARIGPAIEASPYLASIVVDASGVEGKRGADRVTLKRVRNRFLYLRGAKVTTSGMAPQLKSIDADVLILDEVDEMDGRAPSIAVKRLGHSRIAEERYISTPTFPGMGIHARWMECDQRLWHVRCEHCGERQPLSIDQVVTEWDQLGRPVRWNGGPSTLAAAFAQDDRSGRAWAACRKCGKELDRLGAGEWVATYPEREVAGFHLTKLFSPTANLLELVQAFNTTDETKRREAWNQDLGEPYTPKGGQLTDETLDALRREYGHGPVPGLRPVAGVDVGKVLHVVIRALTPNPSPGATGEGRVSRQLWAGETSFDELPGLLRMYQVRMTVMDALPETTKARELQARMPAGSLWLAYYVAQGTKHQDAAVFDPKEGVVNLDRTRTLDQMYGRMYDGTATLPAHARDVRDYYAHLKAAIRVLEDGPAGQGQVVRYVEAGPDHLAHAENYCLVAENAQPATAMSAGHVTHIKELGL
jgi:hypothetical protein